VIEPGTVSSAPQAAGPAAHTFRTIFIDERDGPLPAMLFALTVLAGSVDALSILRLGHVFVATMTGNLVFIGLGLAGAKGFGVGTSAIAFGGFVIGVLIGGRACKAAGSHRGRALRNVLVVKLWLAAMIFVVVILSTPTYPVGSRDAMVVLLAASMGAQLAAIRYLKVPELLTVVLTMTITGALTEHGGGLRDPKMLRRGMSLICFAVGALTGALLILNVGIGASLGFGLAIIGSVAIAAHLASHSEAEWTAPRTPA
jgi:uncharacterized membrane protein YoaK (UPF0700 family)